MKTTNLNKTQKIIRWAGEQKERNIKHMTRDLNQETTNQTIRMIKRLARKGFIKATFSETSVQLNLTQQAYYFRTELVNAR